MSFDATAEIRERLGALPYLKLNVENWHVKLLKRALFEHGHGGQKWEPSRDVTLRFDPDTLTAVTLFQRANNLQVDGIVGPQTWAVLSHNKEQPVTPIARPVDEAYFQQTASYYDIRRSICIIAKALRALKVKEKGVNRGELVDALNRHSIGLVGEPWCASLADFIVDTSYYGVSLPRPFDVGASSSGIHNKAKAKGLLRDVPRPGDLFLVPGGKTGWQHTGIIYGVEAGQQIVTIEGNTDASGSSEGQGIYMRARNLLREKLQVVSVTD